MSSLHKVENHGLPDWGKKKKYLLLFFSGLQMKFVQVSLGKEDNGGIFTDRTRQTHQHSPELPVFPVTCVT